MVMEICDSDLKKLCRTDVTLTTLHINTLLYNLLVGLSYLHSAGIYHRDLKPANCLVNQDCSVKICDFGLSRAIGDEQPNLGELPNTPRGDEDGAQQAVPAVPHTQRLKRHLTGHVVTRWYRAPELILLQRTTLRPSMCGLLDASTLSCLACLKAPGYKIVAHFFQDHRAFHCHRTTSTKQTTSTIQKENMTNST